MPKLDRWTMRARVGRVERERPDLEHSIVKGLYRNYSEMREREPTLDEFREYVHEITSTVEWRDLHEWFSRHEPTVEEKAALLDGIGPVAPAVLVHRPRRPGRPGWTAELFWSRYREALANAPPPQTYRVIAPLFVALDGTEGTSPEYLRKLVRRFGLPPR
jgi:hypothetical protein